MDFDIHFLKKDYPLLEAKAALKLSKLRGNAHPLAALKKQTQKKPDEAQDESLKTTEMQAGFDPLSMLKSGAAKKAKPEEEKKEATAEGENRAIDEKVNEEREKYEKLQEQVTAMKRVEFQEWNIVKDKAISGKLLAIGQSGSDKKEDDSTIMMYMGDDDPEAQEKAQQGKRVLTNPRAGDPCAHGPGQEQTRNSRQAQGQI